MAAKFFIRKKKNLKNIILVNCSYFYIIKLFKVRKKEYEIFIMEFFYFIRLFNHRILNLYLRINYKYISQFF